MGKDTPSARASKWQKRFTRCETNQANLFTKTSKHYDILYAVQNTDNVAPWRSKVYVPILASKAWDLVARLSGVLPYFKTKIKNEWEMLEDGKVVIPESTRTKQKLIDSKLLQDYSNPKGEPMKLKVFDVMLDAVAAGTGFAKASWDFKTEEEYSRIYKADGFVEDMGKEKVKTKKRGCNEFEAINFFNVFIGGSSTSYHKAPYVIVRYFKSIEDLKADDNLSNVDKLATSMDRSTFDQFNQSRNRIVNENRTDEQDETVPSATIFEVYERTAKGVMCGTYGIGKGKNGWVELEKPYKKYWHNHYPVQPFYIRRKTYSPWGESLFENNASLQYATNDLFNHYLDNWNLSIDSMLMYEDGTLTSDFVIEPAGEITYTGEKPDAFKFPEPNPAQLSMVVGVINGAVEAATVPQYLSGVPSSDLDKTAGTAKGIMSISEAANEKIGYMRDNFKQSMVMVGKIWLSNLKQFQDMAEEIREEEKGEERVNVIMPSDYEGEIELTIDDDSLVPMSNMEKRQALQELTSQAMLIQKAAVEQANILGTKDFIPTVNYKELFDESVHYYAVKDPSRFIVKPEEVQSSMPEMGTASLAEMVGGGGQQGGEGQMAPEAAAEGNMGAEFGGYSQ